MLRVVVYDGRDRVSAHLLKSISPDATLASVLHDALRGHEDHQKRLRHPETVTVFLRRDKTDVGGGGGGDGGGDGGAQGVPAVVGRTVGMYVFRYTKVCGFACVSVYSISAFGQAQNTGHSNPASKGLKTISPEFVLFDR